MFVEHSVVTCVSVLVNMECWSDHIELRRVWGLCATLPPILYWTVLSEEALGLSERIRFLVVIASLPL